MTLFSNCRDGLVVHLRQVWQDELRVTQNGAELTDAEVDKELERPRQIQSVLSRLRMHEFNLLSSEPAKRD